VIFIKLLIPLALVLCVSVMAQDLKGWQSESLQANSSVSKPDAQQIDEVLLKRIDRWNAHDIDGCLDAYWKSPELLVVIDSEQFNGWQQLHDSYLNGHLGATAMGFIQPKRIQVRLLKPDLALALTWWTINFPNSHQKKAPSRDQAAHLEHFAMGLDSELGQRSKNRLQKG
jgi:hypothetical protein